MPRVRSTQRGRPRGAASPLHGRHRFGAVLRRAIGALLFVGLTGVTVLPARAAVISGAITSLKTTATTVQQWDRVDLTCTWAVPNGSSPGDTFTLQLPPELRWYGTASFALKAPDGQSVASASASPSGLVTFTLTDYVRTHPVDVHGDCAFSTQYTHATTGGNVTLTFLVGAQVVPVVVGTAPPCQPACTPPHTRAVKDSWWTDGTQQSAQSRIQAPPTTAQTSTLVLTDTPRAGMAVDCSTVTPRIGRLLDADGLVAVPDDSATYPAQVTCSPSQLTVTWTQVPAGEYTEVQLTNLITDPGLSTYSNTGSVTINGTDLPVGTVLVRTDAAGSGTGAPRPPTTTPTTPTPPTASSTTPATAPTPTMTSTTGPGVVLGGATRTPSPSPRTPAVAASPQLAYTGAAVVPAVAFAAGLLLLGLAVVALRPRLVRRAGGSDDRSQIG